MQGAFSVGFAFLTWADSEVSGVGDGTRLEGPAIGDDGRPADAEAGACTFDGPATGAGAEIAPDCRNPLASCGLDFLTTKACTGCFTTGCRG